MTNAHKCDRCGDFYDWGKSTLEGSVIRGSLRRGWYPNKVDLCRKCSDEAEEVLGKWWKAIDFPDKQALVIYINRNNNG